MTWEEQIENAFVKVIKASHEMFLALNMDKDVKSHWADGMEESFNLMDDMLSMRKEFTKIM